MWVCQRHISNQWANLWGCKNLKYWPLFMHQILLSTQNTVLGSIFLFYGETRSPNLGGQYLKCQSVKAAAEKWITCCVKWEMLHKREDHWAGCWKGGRDLLIKQARHCGNTKTGDGQGLSEEGAVKHMDSRAQCWVGGEREDTMMPAGQPSPPGMQRRADGRRWGVKAERKRGWVRPGQAVKGRVDAPSTLIFPTLA